MTDEVSDDEVAEIEARWRAATPGPWQTRFIYRLFESARRDPINLFGSGPEQDWPDSVFIASARADIPALCATVRALRQQITELTAEWCECGHAKTQHGFFSDHDECYECDQMSDDLCCEWRPKPRVTNTYTALREQLAHAIGALKDVRRIVGAREIGADTETWIDGIIRKSEQP